MTPRGKKVTQNQLTIGIKLNKTHTPENTEIMTDLGIGSPSLKMTGFKQLQRWPEPEREASAPEQRTPRATDSHCDVNGGLARRGGASGPRERPARPAASARPRGVAQPAGRCGRPASGLRVQRRAESAAERTEVPAWAPHGLCVASPLLATFPPGPVRPQAAPSSAFSRVPVPTHSSRSLLASSGRPSAPPSASPPFASLFLSTQALSRRLRTLPDASMVSAENQNHQRWRK